MIRIHGVAIGLVIEEEVGTDPFNRPIYEETIETVENVLVGTPDAYSKSEAESFNLTGRRVGYTLAIPKGDTHNWENATVILPPPFEGRYRTIGIPTATIEENTPLAWNKKVQVERYG